MQHSFFACFNIGCCKVGKGDELPIIPAVNRRQWVRKDLGAH